MSDQVCVNSFTSITPRTYAAITLRTFATEITTTKSPNLVDIIDFLNVARNGIYQSFAKSMGLSYIDKYANSFDVFSDAFSNSSSVPSVIPFENFVLDITSPFFDTLNLVPPEQLWKVNSINSSLILLKRLYDNLLKSVRSSTISDIKSYSSRIILMIQSFYLHTNWLEFESSSADFLIEPSSDFFSVAGHLSGSVSKSTSSLLKTVTINSIVNFFTWLKNKMDSKQFNLMFGIRSGKTIAFNIDDTGSMGSIIFGVVEQAKALSSAYYSSPNPPSRYIIQTFNDPTIGTIFMTSNLSLAQLYLDTIRAHDGDDEPELGLTGLKNILINLDDDSNAEIFYYTDASAKDKDLLNEILSLIKLKAARVTFISANSHDDFIEKEIARASNGFEIKINQNTNSVMNTIATVLELTKVNSFPAVSRQQLTSSQNVKFIVDNTISLVSIQIINLLTSNIIQILDPNGSSIVFSYVTQSSELTFMQFKPLLFGTWSLLIDVTSYWQDFYSLQILIKVNNEVHLKVVESIDPVSKYGSEISGSVVSYSKIGIVAYPLGFAKNDSLVLNNLDIIDTFGNVIKSYPVNFFSEDSHYFTEDVVVPPVNFRLKISGLLSGMIFERLYDNLYEITDIKFEAYLYKINGNQYTINYSFTNGRSSNLNLFVSVTDTIYFTQDHTSSTFNVATSSKYISSLILNKVASSSVANLGTINLRLYVSNDDEELSIITVNMNDVPFVYVL